jgi:hypothetical protein
MAGSSVVETGLGILDTVVPGASIITGVLESVASFIKIKGKTKTMTWEQVSGIYTPYMQSVYDVYFSDYYKYELWNIMDGGRAENSKPGGVWVIAMFLIPKNNPQGGFGPVVWGRYGTAEGRIGNSGFDRSPDAAKDKNKNFPDANQLYETFKQKGYVLNKALKSDPVPGTGTDKDTGTGTGTDTGNDTGKAGFSIASLGSYAQYIIIGIVTLALVYMFMKK